MPDATLSQAIQEAYASAPSDEVVFHTLELRHASWGAPIRVVRDVVDLTATLEPDAPLNPGEAVVFTGYAFNMDLPELSDSASPQVTITIDNVSLEIEDAILQATFSTDLVEVTYRAFLGSDLTQPANDPPLTLTLASISASQFQVTGNALLGDFGNRRFPFEQYTAARFPGLVR